MIVSGVNLAGKSLCSQRHTNIIYQCRIFILLFIGNQNSNYIPVFQAGKSGNVSSAPFNAADFPLIFKNRQRSPDRLSADTVSDSQLLFGGKLVDSLLNRILNDFS